MIEIIWNKLPSYIRWPLLVGFMFLLLPIKIYNGARDFIRSEVHAVVNPIDEIRGLQITQMKDDITQIKQDTREIKNHLMSQRR
jgi:hypothetical protein